VYESLQNLTFTFTFTCSLAQSKFIWIGSKFIEPSHAAFSSPINATPFLYSVPPDLACFRSLLGNFGVRQSFGSSDFQSVLERIYRNQQQQQQQQQPVSTEIISLAVAITQYLSDDSMNLAAMEIFAPGVNGVLHPTSTLTYDDAPWLSKSMSQRGDIIFVHPKISSDVGEKIGVKSLRNLLIMGNSEVLASESESIPDLSSPNIQAFGQQESLTRRLHNIIEMYPEGPR